MNKNFIQQLPNDVFFRLYTEANLFSPEINEFLENEFQRRVNEFYISQKLPVSSIGEVGKTSLTPERLQQLQQELLTMPLYKKFFNMLSRGFTLGFFQPLGRPLPPQLASEVDPFFKPLTNENSFINKLFKWTVSDYGFSPAGISEGLGFLAPGIIISFLTGGSGILGRSAILRAISEGGWGVGRLIGEKTTGKFAGSIAQKLFSKIPSAGVRDLLIKSIREGAIISVPIGLWHTNWQRDRNYWEGKELPKSIPERIVEYSSNILKMFPLTTLFSIPLVGVGSLLGTRTFLRQIGEKTTIGNVLKHWLEHGEVNSILKRQYETIATDILNEIKIQSETGKLEPEAINDAIKRILYGKEKLNSTDVRELVKLDEFLRETRYEGILPQFIREDLNNRFGSGVKFLSDFTQSPQATSRFLEYLSLRDPSTLKLKLQEPITIEGVQIGEVFYPKLNTTYGEWFLGKRDIAIFEKVTQQIEKTLNKLAENTKNIAKELLRNDELKREVLKARGFSREFSELNIDDLEKWLSEKDLKEIGEDILNLVTEGSSLTSEKILQNMPQLKSLLQSREQILNNLSQEHRRLSFVVEKLSNAIHSKERGNQFFLDLLNDIGFNPEKYISEVGERLRDGWEAIGGEKLPLSEIKKSIEKLPEKIREALFEKIPQPIAYSLNDLLFGFERAKNFYSEVENITKPISLALEPLETSRFYFKKIAELAEQRAREFLSNRKLKKPLIMSSDIQAFNNAYLKWLKFKNIPQEYANLPETQKMFESFLKTKSGKDLLKSEIESSRLSQFTSQEEKLARDWGEFTETVIKTMPDIKQKVGEDVVREIKDKVISVEPPKIVDRNLYLSKIMLSSFEELINPIKIKLNDIGDKKTSQLIEQLSEHGKIDLIWGLMKDFQDEMLIVLKIYRELGQISDESIKKSLDALIVKYINGLSTTQEEKDLIQKAINFVNNKFGFDWSPSEKSILDLVDFRSKEKFEYYLKTGFIDDISASKETMELREAKNIEDLEKSIKEETEGKPIEITSDIKDFINEFKPRANFRKFVGNTLRLTTKNEITNNMWLLKPEFAPKELLFEAHRGEIGKAEKPSSEKVWKRVKSHPLVNVEDKIYGIGNNDFYVLRTEDGVEFMIDTNFYNYLKKKIPNFNLKAPRGMKSEDPEALMIYSGDKEAGLIMPMPIKEGDVIQRINPITLEPQHIKKSPYTYKPSESFWEMVGFRENLDFETFKVFFPEFSANTLIFEEFLKRMRYHLKVIEEVAKKDEYKAIELEKVALEDLKQFLIKKAKEILKE